jgi:hypothetical protein
MKARVLFSFVGLVVAGCRFDSAGTPAEDLLPSKDGPAIDSRVDLADSAPPDTQPCAQWALEFSGDEWVEANLDSMLGLLDSFSVGVWIKPSALAADEEYQLVSRHSHTYNLGYVLLLKERHPEFRVYQGLNGACHCIDTDTELQEDTWYHLGGSFSAGEARLFLDGKPLETCSCSEKTVQAAATPLRLGAASENAYTFQFEGIIDDVVITRDVWHAPFAPGSLPKGCENVVARYPFSEGKGENSVSDCPNGPGLTLGVAGTHDPQWVQTECVGDR